LYVTGYGSFTAPVKEREYREVSGPCQQLIKRLIKYSIMDFFLSECDFHIFDNLHEKLGIPFFAFHVAAFTGNDLQDQ